MEFYFKENRSFLTNFTRKLDKAYLLYKKFDNEYKWYTSNVKDRILNFDTLSFYFTEN